MKNSRYVAGVKIVRVSGKFEYHIPSNMTGDAFKNSKTSWANVNADAISSAKNELLADEDTEGDTSRGR